MIRHDNAYAAFMVDYAAGVLSPAERMAGDLHCALSSDGRRSAAWLDAIGGAFVEAGSGSPAIGGSDLKLPMGWDGKDVVGARSDAAPGRELGRFLDPARLLGLPWRRDLFGVRTLSAGLPLASLLRFDPGERAPAHHHGRRDVTVVLCGAFADQFGVYERGDLSFAEPGMRHEPRAVGDAACICFLATEPGKPLRGFLGLVRSLLPPG